MDERNAAVIDNIYSHFRLDDAKRINLRRDVLNVVTTLFTQLSRILATPLVIQQPRSIDEQPSQLQGSTGIMSFTPKLVGSANEETRPFYPDEYDYLLIFTELRKCVTIRQDEKNLTTCQFRLSKYGKTKAFLQKYVAQNGDFDLFLFKIGFDFTIRNTLRYLFDQKTRRFGQTNLYHDWAFIETKEITTLHLRWYGDEYKDMPISIDLVPCIKFDDFKPAKSASYWGVDDKVACCHVALDWVRADAERLGKCIEKLRAIVTNIHDCLKTHMLKTCLIVGRLGLAL